VETLGYLAYPPVATGEMAVATAVEKRPDLILMDIILAGAMNGVEAAARIRARLQIPVIYLTAHADQGTLQRAKQTEPYGYILKPVEPRELAIAVEMALHKHEIEKKVRESERRYRTLFASSPDGLLLIDPAGRILMTNPVTAGPLKTA
jgi:CheY-like chemotaxis protein